MFRALKKHTARREITAHLCLVTKQNKKTIKKEDLAHDRFNIYLIMNAVETLLNSPDSQYSFHILYPPVNLLLKHDVGSLFAFPLHWKSESSDKGYFNNCILVMAWPFHLLPSLWVSCLCWVCQAPLSRKLHLETWHQHWHQPSTSIFSLPAVDLRTLAATIGLSFLVFYFLCTNLALSSPSLVCSCRTPAVWPPATWSCWSFGLRLFWKEALT